MGGLDLLDNAVATHQINVKGKKWWWSHFTKCLGILIAGAWKVYQITNSENKVSWSLFNQLFNPINM